MTFQPSAALTAEQPAQGGARSAAWTGAGSASRTGTAAGVIPGHWVMVAIAATLIGFAVLLVRTRIGLAAPAAILPVAAACALAALRYLFRQPTGNRQRIARDGAEYVGLFMLISLVGAAASYGVAAKTTGWVDAVLVRMDAAIGFGWLGWYEIVAGSRMLQWLGTAVYASIFVTPAILLGCFAYQGRVAEARHFLASFWLAAIVSLTLFAFMPAMGPLSYLWHGPIPYMPTSGVYQFELIPALRDGSLDSIDLAALRGLVDIPSFHAVAAVLYMAAARDLGRLRWPITILNLAMLLSIPVEGTHYGVDILLGALVAIGAHRLVSMVTGRIAPRPA